MAEDNEFDEMNDVFMEGHNAYYNGGECPYPKDSEKQIEWFNGYRAAYVNEKM